MSDVLRQLQQQKTTTNARPRLMERYAAFLPIGGDTPNISLGEGYTPLVHARNLGRAIGVPLLHLKVEGMNPTGSFKDRGMVVAVAKALRARDESGGTIEAVTDEEIVAAYRDLARTEGIFCEPASAASVAGVRRMAAEGRIDPGATIVCVLTGHGLKDPDTAAESGAPVLEAAANADAIRELLDW